MPAIKTFALKALIACFMGYGLMACATTEASNSPLQPREGELSARKLEAGECGLFVWAGEARKFTLFSQNGQGAVFALNGNEIDLIPSGDLGLGDHDIYGQQPRQAFSDSTGRNYELSLYNPLEIDSGVQYQKGSLKYKDSNNWDKFIPVYGLSVCKAEI